MEKIQMTICVSAEQAVKIAEILASENTSGSMDATPVQTAPVQTTPVQTAPIQTAPVQTASVQTAPVQTAPVQTAPVQTAPVQAAPVQMAPIQTAPVQTAPAVTSCTYSIEQIQSACAPLMDAGKQAELVGLLAQFGVQSLPMLPPEQYGAFATALRGLGARI